MTENAIHSSFSIFEYHELDLQPAVQRWLGESGQTLTGNNGSAIQVISAGELSGTSGPDFKNMAVIMDGKMLVGDGEFHKTSADWFKHKHDNDSRYDNVILEIVLKTTPVFSRRHTIIQISPSQLKKYIKPCTYSYDHGSVEVLSDLALIRLRRKTENAYSLIMRLGPVESMVELAKLYIEKMAARRNRPAMSSRNLAEAFFALENSHFASLIEHISENKPASADMISDYFCKQIKTEGAHMRQELFINAAMPVIYAISDKSTRYELLLWYRSARTKSKYGILNRRFPGWPQKYIWQQQGMLEHIFTISQKNTN